MKDILIPVRLQKLEIIWIIACFFAAIIFNVVAIMIYKTSWSEVYSQWIWVLVIWGVFYAISVAIRVLYYLAKYFFKK